jgi:hypothetical protein
MATLCRNLRLSIELEDVPGGVGEQVVATLENGLLMKEVQTCYPVNATTPNRLYHRKEAMVIAMRRLVDLAVTENLISISRGPSMSSNTASSSPVDTKSSITLRMSEDA